MISAQSFVSRNDKMPWRVIEDEAVLVDLKKGEVIHANEVGAYIWNFLEGKKNLGDIIKEVCSVFEVDEKAAASDTIEFIQALSDKDLVIVSDA